MSGRRYLRPAAAALGVLLVGAGLWQLGAAGRIHAKAWLAQLLLERAWAATLDGAAAVQPWPWADTHPVARLQVPALGVDQFVLADASGRTLAFGPGLLGGTAAPGTAGHTVLSGHRDTHFRFLEKLMPGTALRLQRPDWAWRVYLVSGGEVIDGRHAHLARDDGVSALTLVTCFPFDAVAPGGPLRYLVFAESVSAPSVAP